MRSLSFFLPAYSGCVPQPQPGLYWGPAENLLWSQWLQSSLVQLLLGGYSQPTTFRIVGRLKLEGHEGASGDGCRTKRGGMQAQLFAVCSGSSLSSQRQAKPSGPRCGLAEKKERIQSETAPL